MTEYRFKFADQDWEVEQIHRLNYAAFVEEIPQHAPNPEHRLVDHFHAENTYVIALCVPDAPASRGTTGQVVGMMALRDRRPFSLDKKLANLDSYLPPHRSLCELRLLYITPAHRNPKVLRGLMEMVGQYAIPRGHDLALISGTTRQLRLYRHFGFESFGPLVGNEGAQFQPMYLTLDAALRQTPWVRALQDVLATQHTQQETTAPPAPRNYLPGPVNVPPPVYAALAQPLISHRSERFLAHMAAVQARLSRLVNAQQTTILLGSGTLANEAVAAQLTRLPGPGLVLSNGEFGTRLADQAQRYRLDFTVLKYPWGTPLDYAALAQRLTTGPQVAWLWCVHSETSTGMLNDLPRLAALCADRGVKLCMDCISSVGAVPLDLSGVYLASGASGKALGSVAGLALVFANAPIDPAPVHIPSYMDVGLYDRAHGVPFTLPSNLLYALAAALDHFGDYDPARTALAAAGLRRRLRAAGLTVLVPDDLASPAVTTLVLPAHASSHAVGERLERAGYLVSYRSRYLLERNWIQICLMGDFDSAALPGLVNRIADEVARGAA